VRDRVLDRAPDVDDAATAFEIVLCFVPEVTMDSRYACFWRLVYMRAELRERLESRHSGLDTSIPQGSVV